MAILLCGCSKKKSEVELTKDNFSKFNSLYVTKVYISCVPFKADPNRRQIGYSYEFPLDPIKGSVILMCIKDSNQTSYDIERTFKRRNSKKGNHGLFIFETKKMKYTMPIFWDDESAYGFWWESPELLSIFRGWGLFEDLAKADPNWPPPNWLKNPPKEMDPNFHRLRNEAHPRGRNINKDANVPAEF